MMVKVDSLWTPTDNCQRIFVVYRIFDNSQGGLPVDACQCQTKSEMKPTTATRPPDNCLPGQTQQKKKI